MGPVQWKRIAYAIGKTWWIDVTDNGRDDDDDDMELDSDEEWEDGERDKRAREGGGGEQVVDGESAMQDEEPPLLPGLYRALYAFEPEGTAEMRLDEDQVVRVIGRGGGSA